MMVLSLILAGLFMILGLVSFFEAKSRFILLLCSQFFFLGLFIGLVSISVYGGVENFGPFIFLHLICWGFTFLWSLICFYLDLKNVHED